MILILISLLVLCLLVLAITVFFLSPGKLKPFSDPNGNILPGSISEKIFMKIGGVDQGMFIRGMNINNPVLLFVHGGPSFPEFFLAEKYPSGMEEYFTVCYWEQRGGGISYTPQVTLASMTFEQLASDAIEVTNYLRQRFGKEKIYLLAHSGGTGFAIQVVSDYPQLYYAYVATSQITNQKESEKLAYKYMLEQYLNSGNSKRAAQLRKYPILENDSILLAFFNSVLRDITMHELGIGTMHMMRSAVKDVFLGVWTCRAYTMKEKINIWKSKFSFIKKTSLRNQVLSLDIPKKIPRMEVPVYFISGKYDLTVNIDLAKTYLKELDSPVKGFYTFENSAHSPMFEEPQRFKEILINDVLNQKNTLADE